MRNRLGMKVIAATMAASLVAGSGAAGAAEMLPELLAMAQEASGMAVADYSPTGSGSEAAVITGSGASTQFMGMTVYAEMTGTNQLALTFENNTDTEFSIGGWGRPQEACLKTTEGEYWTGFNTWMGYGIKTHSTSGCTLDFENVQGEPISVTIHEITNLWNGCPTSYSGSDLTISFSDTDDGQQDGQELNFSPKEGSAEYMGMTVSAELTDINRLDLTFDNNTGTNFSVGGWGSPKEVCLKTTEGEYWAEFNTWNGYEINAHSASEETLYFDNVKGEAISVTIHEITSLVNGLPTFGNASDVIIDLS